MITASLRHRGVLVLGSLLLAGGLQAQTAPFLRIDSVDELLACLRITAGEDDLQVQTSTGAEEWSNAEFFVPAGRSLSFPLPKPAAGTGFFRLVMAPSEPLETEVPDLRGMTLGVLGASVYEFRADGTTGQLALVQERGQPTAYYDFTWSVLDAQPGSITVRTESADGYVEVLNLQFLVVGQIATSITSSEGPGGKAYSVLVPFEPLPTPPGVGSTPASLAGTSWQFTREDLAVVTAAFAEGGTATGPNLETGAVTTWTYEYIPTGRNTATLAVTDADGNFGRFFLIFDTSGEIASFGFSSSSVATLFGGDTTKGSFTRE